MNDKMANQIYSFDVLEANQIFDVLL